MKKGEIRKDKEGRIFLLLDGRRGYAREIFKAYSNFYDREEWLSMQKMKLVEDKNGLFKLLNGEEMKDKWLMIKESEIDYYKGKCKKGHIKTDYDCDSCLRALVQNYLLDDIKKTARVVEIPEINNKKFAESEYAEGYCHGQSDYKDKIEDLLKGEGE